MPGESEYLCIFYRFISIILSYLLTLLNAGGGITERNLQRILEGSGAQEFHCSGRSSKDSDMKFRYAKIRK